ncbi:MAG: hypothetical protein SGARI_003181 [Bacillariaceae sp.]
MKERMPDYNHRQCTAGVNLGGQHRDRHHQDSFLHLHNHRRPSNSWSSAGSSMLLSQGGKLSSATIVSIDNRKAATQPRSAEQSLLPQHHRLEQSETMSSPPSASIHGEAAMPINLEETQRQQPLAIASPQTTVAEAAASREHFLVFIKILFKVLDQSQEVHTRNRAKKLVAECTRKNRQGDPLYTPLMDAVQKRLRLFVGEAHWRKSMMLLRHYYQQQRRTAAATLHILNK